ncbi:MAG: hypothetical protein JO065_06525 [Acidobacteria bacterium]|nr:hypothetical protein [Acidobacteriota bacterium]
MKQAVSFLAGVTAALVFWYFNVSTTLRQGISRQETDHAFLPVFFLSCLIFVACYAGVSSLLARDRRISRENLLRGTLSLLAGLVGTVVFWFVAATFVIAVRKPGAPVGNWLFLFLFFRLLAFFLTDTFTYRLLERRSAARHTTNLSS